MSAARRIAEDGLLVALLFAAQVGLAFLPNVELVSLLVMAYARQLGRRVFSILMVFILLEGLLYGFGIWWVSYLYVWPILAGLSILLRMVGASSFAYGVLSCFFGFSFGFLCALPYLAGGPAAAFSWWIAGIPFDVVHGISNLVLALALFRPVCRVLQQIGPGQR